MPFWKSVILISAVSRAGPDSSSIHRPMTALQIWLLAIRPRTLSISAVPVMVGTALAWAEHQLFAWVTLLVTLGGSVLIQIGTNLHNDAADFERGADTPQRLGPRRVSAEGWLKPGQVRRAAHLSFAGAFLLGIYLVWLGGWPIVVLGLLSLTAAYAYTGGPRPVAYTPLGELFVFLFFGTLSVHLLKAARRIVDPEARALQEALSLSAVSLVLMNFAQESFSTTFSWWLLAVALAGARILAPERRTRSVPAAGSVPVAGPVAAAGSATGRDAGGGGAPCGC